MCADDTRLYISDKSKRGTASQFIAVINGLGCRSCPLSEREERRIRKMPRIIRRNRLLGLKVTRILRHLTQFRRCKKKVAMSPKIPSLVQQDFLITCCFLDLRWCPETMVCSFEELCLLSAVIVI